MFVAWVGLVFVAWWLLVLVGFAGICLDLLCVVGVGLLVNCFSLLGVFVWCVNSVVYVYSFSVLFDTANYLVFGMLFWV